MSDELYGLRINDDYLAHHGILGQKWGKKNGPPYPLDYRKLSAEEKELAKADAIRRGDLDEVQYNKNYFTDAEVNAAINRFQLNKKLSEVNAKHVETGMEKVEKMVSNVKKAAEIVDKGTDAWNVFAKVSNGLGLTKPPHELPVIDKRNPWEKGNKSSIVTKNISVDSKGKQFVTKKEIKDHNGNKTTYTYSKPDNDNQKNNQQNNQQNNQKNTKQQTSATKSYKTILQSDSGKDYQKELFKKNANKLHSSGFGMAPNAYKTKFK